MLALCLMLSTTYYAQNYAGIIGLGLHPTLVHYIRWPNINEFHENNVKNWEISHYLLARLVVQIKLIDN